MLNPSHRVNSAGFPVGDAQAPSVYLGQLGEGGLHAVGVSVRPPPLGARWRFFWLPSLLWGQWPFLVGYRVRDISSHTFLILILAHLLRFGWRAMYVCRLRDSRKAIPIGGGGSAWGPSFFQRKISGRRLVIVLVITRL